MTYAPGRCEISLRANDLGKSAEALLVRFENCVERILRCSDKLCRVFLFTQSSLEIGVRFPDFTHGGIARASQLILGTVEFSLGHFYFVAASKTVKDRHAGSEEGTESWLVVSEIFRSGDADIELGHAHVRVDGDFWIIFRADSSNFVLLRVHVCELCHQVRSLRQCSRDQFINRAIRLLRCRSLPEIGHVQWHGWQQPDALDQSNSRVTFQAGRCFNVECRLRALLLRLEKLG